MPNSISGLAAAVMSQIRRFPLVHRPIHGIAVLMTKSAWGSRFIRSALAAEARAPAAYAAWLEQYDTLTPADRAAIADHVARMAPQPTISVVIPAYATPLPLLRAAIESVRAQLYPAWELCIADDASPDPAVWNLLCDYSRRDSRIKIVRREVNGHICAATNSALALATGEFVALMDHDDLLHERALYEVAAVIERHPDADLIYTDEDKIDDSGRRFEPHMKTDWNPELLLGQNMVSHLGVYRRALVGAVGGLREGFEGSQDYDLTLRVAERTDPSRIHHIASVLYHWRQQGAVPSFSESFMARCADSARRAVAEHLQRLGEAAVVENQSNAPTWLQVRRPAPTPRPLVSVIVPTRDRAQLLAQCAEGVLRQTRYDPLELLIVDNDSQEPETHALFDQLRTDPRVRILDAPGPFNFSALNNRAVAEARGDIVVLLNNDVSVIEATWLDELVAHAVRPSVGAVGARLLFPDGTVQHAGVILGVGGVLPVAGHLGYLAPGDDPGYFGHLGMTRNVSAVTAACMALRRSVYQEVGGLDAEALAVAFNDVDLCLKIRARGYDIVWTPFAELIHHESASRGSDYTPTAKPRFTREIETMRARWGEVLDNDPFYGPNFDIQHSDYRLANPPRRRRPWDREAA